MSLMRSYMESEAAVFFRTREKFGSLSNMASDFPVHVGDACFNSSEAYYQALRWPHDPDIQREIATVPTPKASKVLSRRYLDTAREDWMSVRVKAMRIALRAKLIFHRDAMLHVLSQTNDLPIVEKSFRDDFWGALPSPDGSLKGGNVLGRLWMEIRLEIRNDPSAYADGSLFVEMPDHRIFGQEITEIRATNISTDHRIQLSLDI